MASFVKFYRGLRASYDASTHANGVYFATDSKELLMNGNVYGNGSAVVEDVVFADGILTVTFLDKNTHKSATKTFEIGTGKYAPADAEAETSAIGGIAAGTKASELEGKTISEVLDLLLYPEYAPAWSDAKVAITPASQILEVGSNLPEKSTFTVSGSPAKAVAGKNTATGGAATDVLTASSGDFGAAVTSQKDVTVKVTRTYAAGTDQVKTNKGKATNKTASNSSTLIGNANVNSQIDAASFVINKIDETATATVSFVYAIYASTATAGTATKQELQTSNVYNITLVPGVKNVWVPKDYLIEEVLKYTGGLWLNETIENYDDNASFDLPNGTSQPYTKYTFTASGDNVKYKIVIGRLPK